MNEKKQAMILVCIVFLLLLTGHVIHSQKQEQKVAELTIAVDSQRLTTIIDEAHEHAFTPYLKEMQRLLTNNQALVTAFAMGDRDGLSKEALPVYQNLCTQYRHFGAMNFHSPNSTLLLRLSRPAFYRDNPDVLQQMVNAVHSRQLPERGFVMGRHGLVYRMVQPAFAEQKYIGALEFGIEAEQLITLVRARLSEEVAPYYIAKFWPQDNNAKNGDFKRQARLVISTTGGPLSKKIPAQYLFSGQDTGVAKIGGKFYQIHNRRVFHNYAKENIGGLFIFQDITQAIQHKYQFLWESTVLALLIFLATTATLYHFFDRIIGTLLTEITTRKAAEQQGSAKEEHIRLLLDSTAEGIYGLDLMGRCTFVNKSCLAILGYQEEELLGKNIHDLIHYRRPDGRLLPAADCPMCAAYNGGHEVHGSDELLWHKDGRPVPVEYHAHPISKDGILRGAVVSFINISKRREVETEMRRLAVAIENSADEVIITDLNGIIEYVNPSFERVTGFSRNEAIGQKPSILKSGQHNQAYYRNLWQTIRAGMVWSDRIINKRKDGSLIEEDATISPIYDSQGLALGYVAVKRDVTEKTKMEEHLRHVQKMEAIGTLAGGIAHDFNNILSGIMGFTSLSLMELPKESPIADNLREVVGAAEKAKALVKHILAFSRKVPPKKGNILVQEIAMEVLTLSRCTLPTTIHIKEDIAMELPPVWGDACQIHQVIMNLVTNAFYAMRLQGGTLEIDLQKEHDNGFVVLRIADTGCGIPPDSLAHIFEPYFTTKKQGEGTGLGLHTVHEIITNHGGRIDVTSTEGQGTCFHIHLPVSSNEEQNTDYRQNPMQEMDRQETKGSHVLYVDDDPLNVTLGERILELAGCQVSSFTKSREALEAFKAAPNAFDAVITDQTMPELTGLAMAKEMLRIRADIPIIMVTGHSDLVDAESALQSGIREFLMKPIDVYTLTAALGRVCKTKALLAN